MQRGYSNAALVPSVRASQLDLVNMTETKPLCDLLHQTWQSYIYRISGIFRVGLIFAEFATSLITMMRG